MNIISTGIFHMTVGEMKKLAAELTNEQLTQAHAEMKAYTPSTRKMVNAHWTTEVVIRRTLEDRSQ